MIRKTEIMQITYDVQSPELSCHKIGVIVGPFDHRMVNFLENTHNRHPIAHLQR